MSDRQLVIRSAVAEDQPAVMALSERLVAVELPPGRSADQLHEVDARLLRRWFDQAGDDEQLLVAEQHGAVLGFALVIPRVDPIDQQVGMYLQALAISEAAVGQGIGSRLIAACEAFARERGAVVMSLSALCGNHRARGLYRHLGYTEEIVNYRKLL